MENRACRALPEFLQLWTIASSRRPSNLGHHEGAILKGDPTFPSSDRFVDLQNFNLEVIDMNVLISSGI